MINERVYDLWLEAREEQEWAAMAFWQYVFQEVFFVCRTARHSYSFIILDRLEKRRPWLYLVSDRVGQSTR